MPAIPLPLVLAGPIVRRIEPRSCAFWVALSKSARVSVTVWAGPHFAGAAPGSVDTGEAPLASVESATVPIGAALHVALVTVRLEAPVAPLVPGALYSYDVSFTGSFGTANLRSEGLLRDETAGARIDGVHADAPLHKALGYLPDRLPGFMMQAGTVERLRLVYASCRKSCGPGHDGLLWIDRALEESFNDVDGRPQQLFLTGDQIYADDLGACLLPMLNRLAQDLLGGEERLPVNGQTACTIESFPALRRAKVVRELAGLTSVAADNHLLSFGEFAAMYLAVWSSRAWRTLATADQVYISRSSAPAAMLAHLTEWDAEREDSLAAFRRDTQADFDAEVARVQMFRDDVPRVARVLANVATYMIFDDHDVTDDWNLTRQWRERAYSKPLGQAIVRNGLMAYGLFQGWGNDPQGFSEGKNWDLIAKTQAAFAGGGPFPAGSTGELDTLLGTTVTGSNDPVRWHYKVPGPRHLTVVLDTRTRRSFRGRTTPPTLVGNTLDAQLPPGPLTDGRELLVLVSAAPVLGPEILERVLQPLIETVFDVLAPARIDRLFDVKTNPYRRIFSVAGSEFIDTEGWSRDEVAFEALVRRIASYGRAVILSGDVHYGTTLALDLWPKGAPKPSRIVQLTSSADRNEFLGAIEAMLRIHAGLSAYIKGAAAERIAWNQSAPIQLPPGAKVGPGRKARMLRSPSLLPSGGWPVGTTVPDGKRPDWSWRVAPVRDLRPEGELPSALQPPDLGVGRDLDLADLIADYGKVAARQAKALRDRFPHLRHLVFTRNVGVVSLAPEGGGYIVRHELWSESARDTVNGSANTVHVASLEPTADAAPQLKVKGA